MAKKKNAAKQSTLNIKGLVFKGPKFLVQGLTSSSQELATTKVISTWVMENNSLKLAVSGDGKTQFSGVVKWIGNRNDGAPGTVICAASGKDLRILEPNEDTVQDIFFDTDKSTIRVNAIERAKCSVCGKGLKIFDQISSCPFCGSRGHMDHLSEWIKMRHSCPICKKELDLDKTNKPIPK